MSALLAVALALARLSGSAAGGAVDRSDPVDDARAPVPAPVAPVAPDASGALTVALLPIRAATLSADEAAVIAKLVAIRLERDGYAFVDATARAPEAARDADPASASASARGDIALLVEQDRLGESDVVTVTATVLASGRSFRDATAAHERGELADRLAPLVDGVLQRAVASLPAMRRPEVRARYDEQRIDVCAEQRGWFFCDGAHRAITENEFIRRYRGETNRHDLDRAEIDRQPSYEPWIFLVVGGATALATVAATVALGSTAEGQQFARQSEDSWIVLPVIGLTGALAFIVYGAVELDDTPTIHDGNELMHELDENTARDAASAYDEALLARTKREAAQTPPTSPAATTYPPP